MALAVLLLFARTGSLDDDVNNQLEPVTSSGFDQLRLSLLGKLWLTEVIALRFYDEADGLAHGNPFLGYSWLVNSAISPLSRPLFGFPCSLKRGIGDGIAVKYDAAARQDGMAFPLHGTVASVPYILISLGEHPQCNLISLLISFSLHFPSVIPSLIHIPPILTTITTFLFCPIPSYHPASRPSI